jgi:predicted TIM-barrel fold metal-dependent hydrolase
VAGEHGGREKAGGCRESAWHHVLTLANPGCASISCPADVHRTSVAGDGRLGGDMKPVRDLSRRTFLSGSSLALLGLAVQGSGASQTPAADPIIDIHQHLNYSGRSDDALLAHQRAMGATTTILLPAGRSVSTASTHQGVSNGLQAEAHGNERCQRFAAAHEAEYRHAANEVPDVEGAAQEIARYLDRGGLLIAELKFGVECDSPEMQRIYQLAQAHRVPVLMHWQFQMYNYGFERFPTMLEKYPQVNFLGHAQTWWAHIDRNYRDDPARLYPTGPVTRGGLTDRYLSDYANCYGDLSAGSGLNALRRDEGFTRDFLTRHQDKLVFGSDCSDVEGSGPKCQGAQTIATIRRLAGTHAIERKLLFDNAKKLMPRLFS